MVKAVTIAKMVSFSMHSVANTCKACLLTICRHRFQAALGATICVSVGLYLWGAFGGGLTPGEVASTALARATAITAAALMALEIHRPLRESRHPWTKLAMRMVGVAVTVIALAFVAGPAAYTLATGYHAPVADSLVFLLENSARLPHHLLQAAPALTALAAAGLVAIASIISWRIGRHMSAQAGGDRTRPLLAIALMLAGSLSFGSIAGHLGRQADASFAGQADPARIRMSLQSLPDWDGPAPAQTVTPVPSQRFPVVVVLVESLRHDVLTQHPEAVPFLKSLSAQSISFERSYATASHSNLSDLAFWYSQYPLRANGFEDYPAQAAWRGESLFHAFKRAGYATGYISSQNEKWGSMINWLETPDVDHFFHSEDHDGATWENMDDVDGLAQLMRQGIATAGKIEDSQTLQYALKWIGSQRSFLLGLNLQNTHFSYVYPPRGLRPYLPDHLPSPALYYAWPSESRVAVKNRYLNSVHNVDRLLSQFADDLKRRGIWDECIFVVVGDNGEAFHEHGFGNHSGPMYDEVTRTVSLIKLPRSMRKDAAVVRKPVSHIDIAASIVHLAGLQVPPSFQGVPVIDTEPVRPVYMYSNAIVRQYGIVEGPWKLLLTDRPERKLELFRLDTDPGETVNRITTDEPQARQLANALAHWMTTQESYYRDGFFTSKRPPQHMTPSTQFADDGQD